MTIINHSARDAGLRVTVRGAGGMVVRRGGDGGVRVALIHQASTDEWCFPQGRVRRGETPLAAGLREVHASTGFLCVAEAQLGCVETVDRWGRRVRVMYWAMVRLTGAFIPGEEVDSLQWLRPTEATVRLTRHHEQELLAAALPALTDAVVRRDREGAVSSG